MVESWELLFDILGNHLISVSPGEVDEEIFQTPGRYLSAVWSPTKFYGAHGGYTTVAPTTIKGWVTKTFLSHLEIQECSKPPPSGQVQPV